MRSACARAPFGATDAPLFTRQLETVTPGDLINLPNHRAFVRLMVDGARTRTFSAETLPLPPLADSGHRATPSA